MSNRGRGRKATSGRIGRNVYAAEDPSIGQHPSVPQVDPSVAGNNPPTTGLDRPTPTVDPPAPATTQPYARGGNLGHNVNNISTDALLGIFHRYVGAQLASLSIVERLQSKGVKEFKAVTRVNPTNTEY
ncbi:hypothetical protein V6N13_083216 [Hibiscus sabdariffa]